MMSKRKITDDLDALLAVLPENIAQAVQRADDSDNLLEIILDLGRKPSARFTHGEILLLEAEVSRSDIDYVVERIGDFDDDNRAGLERTLHRIAAIRNRKGDVVGLTCRVGRAVYGTLDIIQDLIEAGKSVLLLGRPGVGKTTLLREAARILAESKRVVIVDTSNEIGGDGDVPHPAVGRARRMQVSMPVLQHEVMIEAVENHNPEVIVIDEIGRELEALAARTIAERGVQLIGTAHGNSLENLLLNPTLSDLVGGIESVTLSDEEARRRGTQKTVLERRSPPTFDVLIEIQTRDRLAVHPDVAEAVDALLRGYPLPPEIRSRAEDGEIRIEKATPPRTPKGQRNTQGFRRQTTEGGRLASPGDNEALSGQETYSVEAGRHKVRHIYAYGVARNRLMQAARKLGVPIVVEKQLSDADVLVTLRTYYRKRQRTVVDAENRGLPVHVLRSNTVSQMMQFLSDIFNLELQEFSDVDVDGALNETRQAISAVLSGKRWVDLPPASAYVRNLQHQLVRDANLVSHSYGREPYRRVRIYREQGE